ncbi:hypothetical protein [Streptomyces sp. NPDC016675]|uniref:hypothetical protein n=1 Tax=Streptomyces sp. NPDC016675 TaxID=3364970 RepID=UPI0036F94208
MSTIVAPLAFSGVGDAPRLERRGGTRRLVQRGDTALVVQDLAPSAAAVRLPAPRPRRYGSCAVSPAGDLAVFAGLHALRAVDRSGKVRWEVRHPCWAGCAGHDAFADYAEERDHRYAGSGSAGFSADGSLVWAHVRGSLANDRGRGADEWQVIDPEGGTVLARAATHTAAVGSDHVPQPDPRQMGLTIGEGQDGAPLRWGRWDGRTLAVDTFGEADRVLLAVSPTGKRLLTVTHDQDGPALARRRGPDATHRPARPPLRGVRPAEALGDGTWYTVSPGDNALHLWSL